MTLKKSREAVLINSSGAKTGASRNEPKRRISDHDESSIQLTQLTNDRIRKVDPDVASKSPMASSDEPVLGMSRQKTEDLVRLLASVQPRVSGAAYVELERRGMTKDQLEMAVGLAQGDSESRRETMEQLVRQRDYDPTPWLAWMGAEAEREVRHKAVSLLGSLNHEQARLKLRLLLARERDPEIARHIQEVLMVSK